MPQGQIVGSSEPHVNRAPGNTKSASQVQVPEPWMLSAFFYEPWRLDAQQRRGVEDYLRARPIVRRGYEEMVRHGRSKLQDALARVARKRRTK
jgi:hypothetical protein